MARSKTSKRWLKEHFDDIYVKMAQKDGYRSRAVYKLLEIQEKTKLIKPGMNIVDLGAAPGAWSVLANTLLKGQGKVFALDLLPIDPIPDVTFVQGDFCSDTVLETLMTALSENKLDLVLSDMAPNMSGNKAIDIPKAMHLCELAVDFAIKTLNKEGALLMKVFHGEGFDALLNEVKSHFKMVSIRKPKASRPRSKETYLLAQEFKG